MPTDITLDTLDAALLQALTSHPRISVLDLSRKLSVARGTAQARLDRLIRAGVIKDFAPTIDPTALGYRVTAFVTMEIQQRGHGNTLADHLAGVPEVLEAHTITGAGDLWVRVVAQTNTDLQRVIDGLNSHPAVLRTSTVIALQESVPLRSMPLVHACAAAGEPLRHSSRPAGNRQLPQ